MRTPPSRRSGPNAVSSVTVIYHRNYTNGYWRCCEIKVPNVRDHSGNEICFNSSLVPPYLKRL
ncbi:MAG: hypothetical protein ACTS73_06150 [Arsenophonus sp. NEOnobi-MAG3]